MFVDLRSDDYRNGDGTGAPIFVDYSPRQYIVYWFFYSYDAFGVLDQTVPLQFHEGDWENIAVHLDCDDRATEVAFYAHGQSDIRRIGGFETEGTHPVVYSAIGTHGSYAQAGDFDT